MPATRSKRKVEEGDEAVQDTVDSSVFSDRVKRFKYNDDEIAPAAACADSATIKSEHASPDRKPLTPQSMNLKTSQVSRPRPRPSPSPSKKKKQSSKYAPPSKYAHLPPLTDVLTPNLICMFVGNNPGIRTATAGHAYAHPSNLFWKLLHSSGCTDTRLPPSADVDLPRLYAMGNTNIVSRPTRDAAELSKAEMVAGTPVLEEKIRKFKPESVCIVGKGIWEAIWRWRYGKQISKDEFRYGWQDDRERMGKEEGWEGARVFVACSTSGLSASLRPPEKEAIWSGLGEWVKQRREERATEGMANPVWDGATRIKQEDASLAEKIETRP